MTDRAREIAEELSISEQLDLAALMRDEPRDCIALGLYEKLLAEPHVDTGRLHVGAHVIWKVTSRGREVAALASEKADG